jgi:predicted O-methyltransferase YrrM
MSPEAARYYVLSLYVNILRRAPGSFELDHWISVAQGEKSADEIYYSFVNSEEYRNRARVSSRFPAGHYYSAIVDPATVADYVSKERSTDPMEIAGLAVPLNEMEEFWRRCSAIIAATPFHEAKNDDHRFYYENGIFSYGDAISLRAMIADLRPRSIIEVGSGFSSACMLDCADEFNLDTKFTFIDPYSERLKGLLRIADFGRVTLLEEPVQRTDINLYRSLRRGDILFIDSTHVLKTGSDVHYELFHILPALAPGVVIHFHDIHFPFEYPDQWIFNDNYSWNEIYALRAFLMYNTDFRIRFWGSCLASERRRVIESVLPLFLKNSGGSIWIEKV